MISTKYTLEETELIKCNESEENKLNHKDQKKWFEYFKKMKKIQENQYTDAEYVISIMMHLNWHKIIGHLYHLSENRQGNYVTIYDHAMQK